MVVGAGSAFVELYAVSDGFTAAVKRRGCVAVGAPQRTSDLAYNGAFKTLRSSVRSGGCRWLHVSLAGLNVAEDKVPLRRAAQLCCNMQRIGGWWSVGGQLESPAWDFPPIARLRELCNVHLVTGHLCGFGGECNSVAGCVTNANFLKVLSRRCPGPPVHPAQLPQSADRRDLAGAGELLDALCNTAAKAYEEARCVQPGFTEIEPLAMTSEGQRGGGAPDSARAVRERENEEAIGGLRNAFRSVSRLPRWAEVGARVRRVIEGAVSSHSSAFEAVLDSLGTHACVAVPQAIELGRAELAREFGVVSNRGDGLQASLFAVLTEAAGDPDVVVPAWLDGQVPLGIEVPIEPGGVFPSVPPSGVGCERNRLRYLHLSGAADLAYGNYASYHEHRELADDELRRELEAGFLDWHAEREILEKQVGRLHLAKIAVSIKVKDGRTKVRLVHDLRRNGTNGKVVVRERLVLPDSRRHRGHFRPH